MQLIIPAFNEQNRLPSTLQSLRAYVLSTAGLPHPPLEVLVVDNGSTDRTAECALAMSTPAMPVRVLHCAEPGKGAAVRAGVAASTADVVGFMDADGANAKEFATNDNGLGNVYPAWSPDGKWISYFSDRSGEYRLYLEAQDGLTPAREITLDKPKIGRAHV